MFRVFKMTAQIKQDTRRQKSKYVDVSTLLHVLHRYSHNSHLNNWMGNFMICVAIRKQWEPVCRLGMHRMMSWEGEIFSCLKHSEEGIYVCIFIVSIQLYNVKHHVVVYNPRTWCFLFWPDSLVILFTPFVNIIVWVVQTL